MQKMIVLTEEDWRNGAITVPPSMV